MSRLSLLHHHDHLHPDQSYGSDRRHPCFELIRQNRWPDGITCPSCTSATVVRNGRDDTQYERRRYLCKSCGVRFDDLSGTILPGHHQPLHVWVLCLYFMELNLSNLQIAKELGIHASDVQVMT